MKHTLSNHTFRLLIHSLEKRGLDTRPMLKAARISRLRLAHPMGRLPVKKEHDFWQLAAEATSDPLIGLHLGEEVSFGEYPLLDYIGANSKTLYDALTFFQKYGGFVYSSWHPQIIESKGEICIDFNTDGLAEEYRHTHEFAFSFLFHRFKYFSGKDVPLTLVRFRHARAGAVQKYARIFGCTVQFNEKSDSLSFKNTITKLTCKASDHFMLGSLLTLADKLSSHFNRCPTKEQSELIAKLRVTIERDLSLGEPQIDAIAKSVSTSSRTLQRKLESEGTTLSDLVIHIRKEMSVGLLRNPKLSYEEIGLTLGYSTLSAFSRAFRQWFKMSPSQYRKTHFN